MTEKVEHEPAVTVVVVVYNMAREAPRTLYSLSSAYQRHIRPDDYEVIVVDNGSDPPLDPQLVTGLSGNFRLVRIDDASPSPAQAVNRGIAEARGKVIGIMVDGARLVTPGLVHFALQGVHLHHRAVVAALGWYLGHDLQRWAMRAGYDRPQEDALLKSIDWPNDGYQLFEIGTLDESSIDGWLAPITESNALFMRRELWSLIEGMDECFAAPGGGLLNIDTYQRAISVPESELVILLGEGTFHQVHGGTATNVSAEDLPDKMKAWAAEFEAIRGHPCGCPRPKNPPTYLGALPRAALVHFIRAALDPVPTGRAPEPPFGPHFDRELWSCTPTKRPDDPAIARVIDLAHDEFRERHYEAAAAVARLARAHAPNEPEPQRLLGLIGAWLSSDSPPLEKRAEYQFALAEADRLLGRTGAAAPE